MTELRTLIVLSLLCALPAGAALAQADRTAGPTAEGTADRTGTADGPLSTGKAPNTTPVGQTKPPSRDASPTSTAPIERRTSRQTADDAISRGICIGCAPDPGTTGALPARATSPSEPRARDAQLNALHDAPKPKTQSELDTFTLASAHREQAKSVEEKTNGLWQSWLVSVCEGCGDQRPAKAMTTQDWPSRDVSMTTGSLGREPASGRARFAGADPSRARPHGSLEGDLSPENVDAIRRMPRP